LVSGIHPSALLHYQTGH